MRRVMPVVLAAAGLLVALDIVGGLAGNGIAVVTATATAAGMVGALAGLWLERRRGLRANSRIASS